LYDITSKEYCVRKKKKEKEQEPAPMNIRTQWGMKNGEWNHNETNRKVLDGDYWSEVLGVYLSASRHIMSDIFA
jgi:glucan-binding YG repeat protein